MLPSNKNDSRANIFKRSQKLFSKTSRNVFKVFKRSNAHPVEEWREWAKLQAKDDVGANLNDYENFQFLCTFFPDELLT